jgi:hypothetical protein
VVRPGPDRELLDPDDLAVDGVDETLNRFLAFGSARWPEEFAQMKGEHLAGEDGRAGHDAVRLTGDPAWDDYLRRMLAAVTQ